MKTWQLTVSSWVRRTFGDIHQESTLERSSRFLEEAVEYAQACGLRQELAQAIFNKVYSKEPGEPHQEAGGVFITFLALSENKGVNAYDALVDEFKRINDPETVKKVQARQNEKRAEGLGI